MRYLVLFMIVGCLASCAADTAQNEQDLTKEITTEQLSFCKQIEQAHQKDLWDKQNAFRFHFYLEFRGKKRMDGIITMQPNNGKVHMALDNGITATFDGEKAWYAPDTAEFANARFNIRTWPYFTEAAYKLNDPGSNMENMGLTDLNGTTYHAGYMTFGDNVGDSPDDWYIVYADTSDHLLKALAYIVTYKKTQEKANEDPHAITYSDYVDLDGIPIASHWEFHTWRDSLGLTEKLGDARLSDMEFVTVPDSLFHAPAGAVEAELIN